MIAKATNKYTGEVTELEVSNLKSLMYAYNVAKEYEDVGKKIKDQLKDELENYLDESGKSEELDGQQFKRIPIQRMTYDKSLLRELVDEDTFDVLIKVDKSATDKYLKENLEKLGDISTQLRKSMVVDGKPYSMTKLEKLERNKQ